MDGRNTESRMDERRKVGRKRGLKQGERKIQGKTKTFGRKSEKKKGEGTME